MITDDIQNAFIEPAFYSVLKEFGCSTARFKSGKYKTVEAQQLWIAYLVGKNNTAAQHELERYPDDDEESPAEFP